MPKAADIAQYERLAEDWRHYDNIIWELPSVAVAIMAGLLGVAFQFLANHPFPRALLLGIGSLFIFALAIALAKHRLFMNMRSSFLCELETKFGIKALPMQTDETRDHLKQETL